MSTPFDLTHTDKLLTTTRSVRKRLDLDRPVPREVVLECLDIALQAPSGGNSQPWRWLIVDAPDIRRGLAELYRRSHDPYMAANREAAKAAGRLEAMGRIMDSSQHLSDHMGEVPVLVIPCLLSRPERLSQGEIAGFYGSILPAAWSLMLALRSRGLGSAWTTLHLAFEQEAAELLGIPDTATQTALIPVAYYTGDDFRPAPRKPAGKVTYFNTWKQR
ncbi:nitroreductase family protein [soil metagenome]